MHTSMLTILPMSADIGYYVLAALLLLTSGPALWAFKQVAARTKNKYDDKIVAKVTSLIDDENLRDTIKERLNDRKKD